MHVEKWPNILLKFCGVKMTKFLKYVWPLVNIMHEKVIKEKTPKKYILLVNLVVNLKAVDNV